MTTTAASSINNFSNGKSTNMKVYAAINAVMSEISKSGISKSQTNSLQKYQFRGIDDVLNALSPLLAKHGLCILPRVLSRECIERSTKAGSALFYVVLEVEFDFVCSEDGSKHIVKAFGEAMDSGDKATNKALSAAYKTAMFQAFCIPTEGDNDADASSPDVNVALDEDLIAQIFASEHVTDLSVLFKTLSKTKQAMYQPHFQNARKKIENKHETA